MRVRLVNVLSAANARVVHQHVQLRTHCAKLVEPGRHRTLVGDVHGDRHGAGASCANRVGRCVELAARPRGNRDHGTRLGKGQRNRAADAAAAAGHEDRLRHQSLIQ